MSTVLLVIHIMIAVALVAVILLQRSNSDGLGGLGGGGSGGNNFLSGRASANLLTRTTAVLATLFIVNSLLLAIIASRGSHHDSLIQAIEQKDAGQQQEAEKKEEGQQEEAPAAPSVPIAE